MRWTLRTLVFAFASVPALGAQGSIAGLLTAEGDGGALACVEVQLLDSAGTRITRTFTYADGAFQLSAPTLRQFRLEFSTWGMMPVTTALTPRDPATDHESLYRVRIEPAIALDASPSEAPSQAPSQALSMLFPGESAPELALPQMSPVFPYELRRRLENGTAVARFVVDTTGRVRDGSIVQQSATHPAFFSSTRDFLRRARYRPARRGGAPVCTMIVQAFVFQAR